MGQLKMKSDEWWNDFITKAPLEPLVDPDSKKTNAEEEAELRADLVASADPKMVKSGQDFFFNNFGQMVFALIATALMGFSVKSTTTVLLRNSNFLMDPHESVARNLRTLRQVFRWYKSPNFSLEKIFEQQIAVRRIHLIVLKKLGQIQSPEDWTPLDVLADHATGHEAEAKLAEAIRKDLAYVDTTHTPPTVTDYYPAVPLSQFNMVCTLASGFAFLKMHAKMMGIRFDKEGLDGLVHSWALIGRATGVKDRYNIALHDDRFDSELSQRYIDSIVLGGLKSCDTTTVVIHKNILQGLAVWAPIPVSYKGFMFMTLSEFSPEFKGLHLKKLMNWWDHLWVSWMRLSLYLIANYSLFQVIASYLQNMFIFNAFHKYLGLKDPKLL